MFSDFFESVDVAHGAREIRVSSRSQGKCWDEGGRERTKEDEEETRGKARL